MDPWKRRGWCVSAPIDHPLDRIAVSKRQGSFGFRVSPPERIHSWRRRPRPVECTRNITVGHICILFVSPCQLTTSYQLQLLHWYSIQLSKFGFRRKKGWQPQLRPPFMGGFGELFVWEQENTKTTETTQRETSYTVVRRVHTYVFHGLFMAAAILLMFNNLYHVISSSFIMNYHRRL